MYSFALINHPSGLVFREEGSSLPIRLGDYHPKHRGSEICQCTYIHICLDYFSNLIIYICVFL